MEVLDERWTLLVVRELLMGSTRFNELRRGLPRMSSALLVKRLRSLERAGLVSRTTTGRQTAYSLTEAGRDLLEVVNALGVWGLRWISELGEEDLDPHLLLWDMRRTMPVDAWPRSRTVLELRLDDVAQRTATWWIVVDGEEVDVCDADPGFEVTAGLITSLRTMTRLWRGEVSWEAELRAGRVRVQGAREVRSQIPRWIGTSALARKAALIDSP